jgi:hypothetical protein
MGFHCVVGCVSQGRCWLDVVDGCDGSVWDDIIMDVLVGGQFRWKCRRVGLRLRMGCYHGGAEGEVHGDRAPRRAQDGGVGAAPHGRRDDPPPDGGTAVIHAR